MMSYWESMSMHLGRTQRESAEDDEPCGCNVPPRWCAWNGPCCDQCSHEGADHADCPCQTRPIPPGCEHEWSERGSGPEDRWQECWLCGTTRDLPPAERDCICVKAWQRDCPEHGYPWAKNTRVIPPEVRDT